MTDRLTRFSRAAMLAFALMVAAPAVRVSALTAQEWNLGAHAGRIRAALDPAKGSESFAVGLRYDDANTGVRLSAGLPTTSREPLWLGAGALRRFSVARSGFRAGVDMQGTAFLAHDRAATDPGIPGGLLDPPLEPSTPRLGHALAAQALPIIGYETTHLELHARAGASRYVAAFGDERLSRSVQLADMQLTVRPNEAFALLPVIRLFAPRGERSATFAGTTALAGSQHGSLWASIGTWLNGQGDDTPPWAAGARLRLHRLVTLDASARHDSYDPLYLQPAQTSWSVGLSVQIWRRTTPAPVPAQYANGRATIRLKATNALSQLSVAGDFNNWKPAPMQRSGGDWIYTVAVAPGVYNYAFVDAQGRWFVPESVPGRRDDGMGGHVAVLVVQ